MTLVLADTSIWAAHFRLPDRLMAEPQIGAAIVMHPMVIGELAMGNLPKRAKTLKALMQMDAVVLASSEEVFAFVDRHRLQGTGLSWVDAHLLVSALLTPDCDLWTHDPRLDAAASRFGRAARFNH